MTKVIAAVVLILTGVYFVRLYLFDAREPVSQNELVPIVATDEVLEMIRQGKKVVFVDSRERQEWEEERIPGAINITLREVPTLSAGMFDDPDLIIAYCVKDFRGVELAKALQNAGFRQASILEELGLSGWKRSGLPTAVAGRRNDREAMSALMVCVEDPTGCAGRTL